MASSTLKDCEERAPQRDNARRELAEEVELGAEEAEEVAASQTFLVASLRVLGGI